MSNSAIIDDKVKNTNNTISQKTIDEIVIPIPKPTDNIVNDNVSNKSIDLHIELPKLEKLEKLDDKNSKIVTIITSPKEKNKIKLKPLSPTIKPKSPIIINSKSKIDVKDYKDKILDIKKDTINLKPIIKEQRSQNISDQDLHISELHSLDLNNRSRSLTNYSPARLNNNRDISPLVHERSSSPKYYRDISVEKRRLSAGTSPRYTRSFSPYALHRDSSPVRHVERTSSLSSIVEEKNDNQVANIEIMPLRPSQPLQPIQASQGSKITETDQSIWPNSKPHLGSSLNLSLTSPLNFGSSRDLFLTTPRRTSLTTPYINRPNSPTLPTNAIYNEMLRHKPSYSHFNANYNFINSFSTDDDNIDDEFDAIIINKSEAIEPEPSVVEMIAFITKLTHLLHKNGETMHRLQNIILCISKIIGLDCSIAATSNLVILTFGDRLTSSSLYHRKINLYTDDQLADLNMYHLNYLQNILHGILESKFTFRQSCSLLYGIDYLPKIYNEYTVLASLTISSGCICVVFFNGSYQDFLFSCALGLLVGLFAYASEKITNLGRLQNILSAFLTSFIAAAVSYTNPNFCLSANTLSAFVWLLPGFSFTTAVIELANSSIVSGTSRLFVSLLACLQIGFGVTLGLQIGSVIVGGPFILSTNEFSTIDTYLTLIVYGYLSPQVGISVALVLTSLLLGIISNSYARLGDRPCTGLLLIGVMLLVPRSIGSLSISAIINTNFISGVGFAFQMMIVGLAITIGISISNLVIKPEKVIHSYSY